MEIDSTQGPEGILFKCLSASSQLFLSPYFACLLQYTGSITTDPHPTSVTSMSASGLLLLFCCFRTWCFSCLVSFTLIAINSLWLMLFLLSLPSCKPLATKCWSWDLNPDLTPEKVFWPLPYIASSQLALLHPLALFWSVSMFPSIH